MRSGSITRLARAHRNSDFFEEARELGRWKGFTFEFRNEDKAWIGEMWPDDAAEPMTQVREVALELVIHFLAAKLLEHLGHPRK